MGISPDIYGAAEIIGERNQLLQALPGVGAHQAPRYLPVPVDALPAGFLPGETQIGPQVHDPRVVGSLKGITGPDGFLAQQVESSRQNLPNQDARSSLPEPTSGNQTDTRARAPGMPTTPSASPAGSGPAPIQEQHGWLARMLPPGMSGPLADAMAALAADRGQSPLQSFGKSYTAAQESKRTRDERKRALVKEEKAEALAAEDRKLNLEDRKQGYKKDALSAAEAAEEKRYQRGREAKSDDREQQRLDQAERRLDKTRADIKADRHGLTASDKVKVEAEVTRRARQMFGDPERMDPEERTEYFRQIEVIRDQIYDELGDPAASGTSGKAEDRLGAPAQPTDPGGLTVAPQGRQPVPAAPKQSGPVTPPGQNLKGGGTATDPYVLTPGPGMMEAFEALPSGTVYINPANGQPLVKN